jgi:hypothetical protein
VSRPRDQPRHQGLPRPYVGDPGVDLLGRTQPNKSALGATVPSEAAEPCHAAISRNIYIMTLKVLEGRILPLGARSTCQCAESGDQCKE